MACAIILVHWLYIDRKYAESIDLFEENARMAEGDTVREGNMEEGIREGRIPEEGICLLAAMSSRVEADRSHNRLAVAAAFAFLAGILALGLTGTTQIEGAALLITCAIPGGILYHHLRNVSTGFAKRESGALSATL